MPVPASFLKAAYPAVLFIAAAMRKLQSAHVFCEVIDNFGDAGVCWRLSRALAAQGLTVTLWIDDLQRLQRLRPALNLAPAAARAGQAIDGFCVRRWQPGKAAADAADVADVAVADVAAVAAAADADADAAASAEPADLVIAAFGCRLPASYLAAMAALPVAPVWINLEYLSAEAWVAGSHALPSPHPRLPLTEHFYFPGFTTDTGGLLKEAGYEQARLAFGAAERRAFLAGLGIAAGEGADADARPLLSLFCYPSAGIEALFAALARGPAVCCVVPEGVTPLAPAAGQVRVQGALTLFGLPFLEPDDYDRLLWSCDLNFVRGEDSAVRAQWARRPLLWQLYPQDDAAHRAKLDAFLGLYTRGMPAALAAGYAQAIHAWNGDPAAALDWPALLEVLPGLREHAGRWAGQLSAQHELARGLIEFAGKIG